MRDISNEIIDLFVKESIMEREYILANLDLDLLQSNVIDSLNVIILISLFEEKFKIEFDPDDVVSKNWMSVNAIINTVKQKLNIGSKTNGE